MKCLALSPPDQHITATDFVTFTATMTRETREEKFLELLRGGHVPSAMRTFLPVTIEFIDGNSVARTLEFYVLPDYLRIGNDSDSFIVPLWPITAQKIADDWGCLLPTPKLVTVIWNAATQLPPKPWGPPYDHSMMSTSRIMAHNQIVTDNMNALGVGGAAFVAGHKKDVVITNRLMSKPNNVAIFGWHQSNGKPIQPVYLGHVNTYGDYSHGIRLISQECRLDDQIVSLESVMRDPMTCGAISDEGVMQLVRQPNVD